MKTKFLLVLASLLLVLGLFYITNKILRETFEWYTIPILAIVWIVSIMGTMLLFSVTTDSDDSKGEEDKRKGKWYE